MLGQLFLLLCLGAMGCAAGITFMVLGPVPVKRRVTIVPRLPSFAMPSVAVAPIPTLVAQLAPAREQRFTPPQAVAPVVEPAPVIDAAPRKPKGAKVQPLPRKRAAKGTDSPFAPVVRGRQIREEEAATNPVRLVTEETTMTTTRVFDDEELTRVDN